MMLVLNHCYHVHPDGKKRGQMVRGTCPWKWESTYRLTSYGEAQIVRWYWPLKKRDHVHPGTWRGQNHEVALVLEGAKLHTTWWRTRSLKLWGGTLSFNERDHALSDDPQSVRMMRLRLSFNEQDHVPSDGPWRRQNCGGHLSETRWHTTWWPKKRQKLWGCTCPSKN